MSRSRDDPDPGIAFPAHWAVFCGDQLTRRAVADPTDLVVIDARTSRVSVVEEWREQSTRPIFVIVDGSQRAGTYLRAGADMCVGVDAVAQEWDARLQAVERLKPIATPRAVQSPDDDAGRVLLVGDIAGNRTHDQHDIRAAGYHPQLVPISRLGSADTPDLIVMPADPAAIVQVRLELGDDLPILALSDTREGARSIACIRLGAFDVIARNSVFDDLGAHIDAVIRRRDATPGAEAPVRTGALEIDLAGRQARARGIDLKLTPLEFGLLSTLARNIGEVVPHSQLLAATWGPGYLQEKHYVRTFVHSLRSKLEHDPANPRYLLNDRGRGYLLAHLPPTREGDAAG